MESVKAGAEQSRGTWNSRMGFILAAAGVSIGIGNIWRFPYLVGQNGGGAFIVAYVAILALVGIPIMIMEVGIGKSTGKGTIDTYVIGTGKKGLGALLGGYIAVIPIFINMTYIGIIGYVVYYMYVSFTGMWNSVAPDVIYKSLVDNKLLLVLLFSGVCIINSWVVYRGVNRGLELACKFMIPLVFVGLIPLLVRAMFLPNILKGLNYYMDPNWGALCKLSTWAAAGGQAAFSLGIGPSLMIVYGSHLRRNTDVTVNVLTVALLDTSVALLAGFAIIPATVAAGMDPTSGAPLIFIVLPTLFKMIPGGQILGVIFFIAVFFAGFSSSISHLETPVTSYMDHFGWSRGKAVIIFTLLTIAGGVVCVYNMQFLDIISRWIGDYCYSLSAVIGVIVFGWIYGVDKIRKEVNTYSDFKLGEWYNPLLKIVSTGIMAAIVIHSFF